MKLNACEQACIDLLAGAQGEGMGEGGGGGVCGGGEWGGGEVTG